MLLAAGLLVAGAALAASGGVIRVGATASQTGDYAELGIDQLQGLQMWADDLNVRGALLGKRVELVVYDDRSDPARVAELYEDLVTQDGVDFLIGPYSSDLTLAAAAVAERHGVPMVAAGAAAGEIWRQGFTNVFQIDAQARDYFDLVIAYAAEQGLKRVAVAYAGTDFPREVAAGVREEAAAHGMQVVFDEEYPNGSLDFTDMVARMRGTNPEVLLGGTYLDDSIALVRAAKAALLSPKIFAMTVGPSQRAFGDQLEEDADGIMGVVSWMRSGRRPMAYDFSFRYKERYGSNAAVQAAYGYSAGQVLEAAVRLARTTDHEAVRNELRTMKFRSLLGKYRVDDTGIQREKRTFVMQWHDRYRLLVLPEDIREVTIDYPFVPWSER
jgi:branched-chain amino acid transport system substrate-binding protein